MRTRPIPRHPCLWLLRAAVAFSLLLMASTAQAAPEADPSASMEARTSWYAFPTVFYTPETSLGLGAAGGRY